MLMTLEYHSKELILSNRVCWCMFWTFYIKEWNTHQLYIFLVTLFVTLSNSRPVDVCFTNSLVFKKQTSTGPILLVVTLSFLNSWCIILAYYINAGNIHQLTIIPKYGQMMYDACTYNLARYCSINIEHLVGLPTFQDFVRLRCPIFI